MKKLFAVLLVAVLALSLVACGNNGGQSNEGQTNEEKHKIGVLSLSLTMDFPKQIDNGIHRAAEEKGYECMSLDTNLDPEKELSCLDQLLDNDVKAFYTISISPENVWEIVQQKDASVGILSQSPSAPATANIREDNEGMARAFLESLEAWKKENGIANVQLVNMWLADCEFPDRPMYEGRVTIEEIFEKEMAAGDTVAISFFGEDVEVATGNAENALNAYPDATVFFCYNNNQALACTNVLKSAGVDCSKYYIFSSETDAESLREIADPSSPFRGAYHGSIEELGYNVGLELIKYLETGEMNDVPVPKVLVDERNISDYQ